MNKKTQSSISMVVMAIASIVLLFASATKYWMIMTKPTLSLNFWDSREFIIIQIFLTTGLGIWLICGLFRKAGWLLAVLAFIVFILDSTYKGIVGADSCGCFGEVAVNPWVTVFAINLPILALLLIFRPKHEKLLPPPFPSAKHFFSVAIPTFILLGAIVISTLAYEPPQKSAKYAIVDHEGWIGTEFEMLSQIDIAESLSDGLCVIMFYRINCSVCHEMMPIYIKMNEQAKLSGMQASFAFIQMPPYGDTPQEIQHQTECLTGTLDESKKWYTATPLLVVIEDKIVLKSWENEIPASFDELLEAIFQ